MNIQRITLGGGCFWCTEAIFQSLKGVLSVSSGYMGGTVAKPTYMDVCTGKSGHAEVVDVQYDADTITLEELLLIFFKTHNPTTPNRQGGDKGTQYRSVIFYRTDEQERQAQDVIDSLTKKGIFDQPIVTELTSASEFYIADAHHQDYYNANPLKPYCITIIHPKLTKLMREFTDKVKPELL